jgi:hypothetical protein
MRPEDPFYPHRVESYLDEIATEELRRQQMEDGIDSFLEAFNLDDLITHSIALTQEDPLKQGLQNGIINFDNRDNTRNQGWQFNSIKGESHQIAYGAPYDSYARNDGLHVVTTVAEMHSTLGNEPLFAFLQTIRREPGLESPLTEIELRNSYPALLARRRAGSLSLYANNFDGTFQHWVEAEPARTEGIVTTEFTRYVNAVRHGRQTDSSA